MLNTLLADTLLAIAAASASPAETTAAGTGALLVPTLQYRERLLANGLQVLTAPAIASHERAS